MRRSPGRGVTPEGCSGDIRYSVIGAKSAATLGTALATYNLGGNKNTWRRDRSVSDFSNSNFRVRVIDVANSTARDFRLNKIAVMVTYY
jgi:hypothetical protein